MSHNNAFQPCNLHLLSLPIHLLQTIMRTLDPTSLATMRAVCRAFNNAVNTTDAWQHLFSKHWRHAARITSYQAALSTKMSTAVHWRSGRTCGDLLYGHRNGVRSVCIVSGTNLLLSGSKDSTVRLWDLQRGTLIASSRSHNGGTVRCVAAHNTTIASAASDGRVRVWHNMDLTQRPTILPNAHAGPVSCVAINANVLATGSWDSTVRVWRHCGECVRTLGCSDWVSQVLLRGERLHVRAGTKVYSTDIETGATLCVTETGTTFTAAEATYDGRVLFTAAENGCVTAHDLQATRGRRVVFQARSAVSSLALEHPWMAVGHMDGSVVMVDICLPGVPIRGGFWCGGGGAASLDLCDGWLALAGQASNVVRTWRVLPNSRSGLRRCGDRVATTHRRVALTSASS